jgi:hypothetical protein
MSVHHVKAFSEALNTDDDQKKKSRYFRFFNLPFIPEFYFSFNNYHHLVNIWNKSSAEEIDAYLRVFKGKGALKSSLNWYRANIGYANTATWTGTDVAGIYSISCEVIDSNHGSAIATIDIIVS